MSRTRTITWQDPVPGAKQGLALPGIEYLRKMQAGELPPPPIAVLMDMRIDKVEEGQVVFSFEPAEYHYNPIGGVHGGVISTLLDSAVACSVHSTLPAGMGYSSLELKVNFIRGLSVKTGRLFCEGNVLSAGRRVATAEGKLVDENGKLYAHATTTCLLFPLNEQG